MRRLFILPFLFLAAATLHSQSFLDIEIGWSRDSAMKLLAAEYRVADTVVITTPYLYEEVVRLAPVRLAGYEGFAALHSDSTGVITEIVWVQVHENIYATTPAPWGTFTRWQAWDVPAVSDYQTILKQLSQRFDAWPRRITTELQVRDSTSPQYGWANDSVSILFSLGRMFTRSELRFARWESRPNPLIREARRDPRDDH